jgi:hypothetical protein
MANRRTDGSSKPLEIFLGQKKGISKKIRGVLDGSVPAKNINELQHVKTFIRLTELQVDNIFLEKLVGVWNSNLLPNKVREFLFHFTNNTLPINTRLSHYVENVSRRCTLCGVNREPDPPDENFKHLFNECPVTAGIHTWFINNYFPGLITDENRNSFFFGTGVPGRNPCNFLVIIPLLVQYLI